MFFYLLVSNLLQGVHQRLLGDTLIHALFIQLNRSEFLEVNWCQVEVEVNVVLTLRLLILKLYHFWVLSLQRFQTFYSSFLSIGVVC